ncbi:PIG-L family deacetylase [Streptomyces sp. NPDC008317]|uniref:PIG-L deacetylase family protein n=1 Tax=Streptomyces sp. NPDC008317 TaxID=3364827 RepID=UPI0036E3E9E5
MDQHDTPHNPEQHTDDPHTDEQHTDTPHTELPEHADPLQAPGTDEEQWRAWDGWAHLADTELPTAGRVVVVAAHPDDEVLGVGGSIALLAAAGVAVTVVSVTDGELSHADSTAITSHQLVGIRAAELREALAELGADAQDIVRLRVADTEVAGHEDEVAAALVPLLSDADLCLAPWTGDVHSDHEAAGRAALTAARKASVPCLLYPVWMWHWARPADPRVPWASASLVRLPEEVAARKRAAVQRFVSQARSLGSSPDDAAVLPPGEIAHHVRDFEVVFTPA